MSRTPLPAAPSNGPERRPSTVPNPKKFSLTGSCTGLMRTQRGCFAIPHKHKLTGYKHPSSETNLRTLGGETSYKFFYENAIPALKKPSKLNYRPKLEPYKESALCNRLPVTFNNEPMKGVRFCAPRNTHTEWTRAPYERGYHTTNRCFYPKWDNLPIGFENQGIMSDFAAKVHVNQHR